MTVVLLLMFAAVGVVATLASDDDDEYERHDHEEAYEAFDRGDTLPLTEVLEMVSGEIGGEIIEIEFEIEHGRPVYEFKYVDDRGRVRELYVDARDGSVLDDRPD